MGISVRLHSHIDYDKIQTIDAWLALFTSMMISPTINETRCMMIIIIRRNVGRMRGQVCIMYIVYASWRAPYVYLIANAAKHASFTSNKSQIYVVKVKRAWFNV